MIDLILVGLGGALGALIAVRLHRNADRWHIVAINCAVCALLGGLTAADRVVSGPLISLVGHGALLTAAPLTSVLLPLSAAPGGPGTGFPVRRTARALALNTTYCAAFALIGYLSMYALVGIYYKLSW